MSRHKRKPSSDLGSARVPINLGYGTCAYKRGGKWRYRNSQTDHKFIEAKDGELLLELARRGYRIVYTAHECIDRPHLPCPACEGDTFRALGIAFPPDR
jgi:hypothetical protein